ncbi:MAG TPA: LLM class F420-dependent oxidoreductase [Stellaceae bacterium]|nr:LLM class F420-dependent oxidoreductase [Stellaceae bacterium]
MRLGALFPQFEIGADPAAIRDFAEAAEALGYAHITAFDQVIGLNKESRPNWKYVHDAEDMFHELFVLFGFLAALTSRVELVTGVLLLPMRGTAVVAKQAAEVDVLSRGRLRLGIGVGIKPEEFEACGENFKNRGRRADEQIEVLRRLWTAPLITYEGRYHRIGDGGLNPLPVQRPIPIWIGGITDAAIERVARLGDGWLPNFQPDDVGRRAIETMRASARRYGRDPAAIGIEATMTIIDRTPDQLRAEVEAWRKLGASHITVNTMPERWVEAEQRWNKASIGHLTNPTAHIEAIRKFRDALPELF